MRSTSYGLKLLLATGWLFSRKFQSLPATNKKKLTRHEISRGGVRQRECWITFQNSANNILWSSYLWDVDIPPRTWCLVSWLPTAHLWRVYYMSCEIWLRLGPAEQSVPRALFCLLSPNSFTVGIYCSDIKTLPERLPAIQNSNSPLPLEWTVKRFPINIQLSEVYNSIFIVLMIYSNSKSS